MTNTIIQDKKTSKKQLCASSKIGFLPAIKIITMQEGRRSRTNRKRISRALVCYSAALERGASG